MPDNPLENNYSKFASSLASTIRKLSLYPAKHPAVVYSVKNLNSMLQEILNAKGAFSLNLSSDNQILVEGQPVGEKGSKLIDDLAADFRKLDIESLTISPGIADKELEEFIRVLLMEPEEIKKTGDLNKIFQDKGIQHIQTSQFSYVKVKKGKVAVEVGQENRHLFEELKTKIKDFSRGKIQEPGEIQKLEKDVIDTATAEFRERNKLPAATKNMLKKFLMQSQDTAGVISRLNSALIGSGCPPEEAEKLINKIGREISRKPAAGIGAGGIKKEEAEELIKRNLELESRVGRLRKELEEKAAAYEELTRESKRVAQEKERVDNIVHHMAEGLVVVDSNGNIVMLNPVAEKLLGLGKENIGVPLSNTVKDEHLLTMVKNIMPAKDGTIEKDIEFLSPDESTRRVLRTSSAVVEDHNGKTVGMVTVLNDITRQREIEKMKSDFVANVSHELRTPLATIQQNISLLMEELPGGLNDAQKKFLNIAQDNIKRLRRLINDLLDSAAIEAGKFRLRLSRAEVNERINNVVTFLSRWAQTKNIDIRAQLLPGAEIIEMDKDRIEQVLTNLISNAIKFTSEGGKIFVSAVKTEPAGDSPQGAVEISVKDTGPGIAPEDLKKIFNKFERAGAVSSGVGGTGLGLSICQEILKLHGGRIRVESRLNEGSNFSFLIPIKKEEASGQEPRD
ncbi:MAG: ATP-binding protein [Candidatus Omnitrophota bacterium]